MEIKLKISIFAIILRKQMKKRGIAKGFVQICDAIELTKHLPKDIRILLDVIFEYRNKMFHNGFEWPKAERSEFLQEIQKSKCPGTWFNNATWGNDPWICYLSQDFINRCIYAIEETLDGIDAYDRWADAQKSIGVKLFSLGFYRFLDFLRFQWSNSRWRRR